MASSHCPVTYLLFLGYLEIQTAQKLVYRISDGKISWKIGQKYKEIPLSEIAHYKVKKTILDVPSFKTGSILFYNEKSSKPLMKFEHIRNVLEVFSLIQLDKFKKGEKFD